MAMVIPSTHGPFEGKAADDDEIGEASDETEPQHKVANGTAADLVSSGSKTVAAPEAIVATPKATAKPPAGPNQRGFFLVSGSRVPSEDLCTRRPLASEAKNFEPSSCGKLLLDE